MRPWASWTAKTAVFSLAAGLAATAAGSSAWAAPGSEASVALAAVGALLAGASALKIAGRRARDRKAGIGVVAQ
jgi:hypothetical protein